ncbi:FtsH protease activity modulator HflK [Pantoea sp. SoEX]|uniref:FtsH protease activity modulator HflK n=1 Tax=Pantoea sp. SoEX TaxID=2576763 RepID=UPI00135A598F|nr:FtsH protease activity modulator HflK [Pantoea sp. SoEX]MXP51330.1 FtsH protease activity modulator HflK [Pantoea sp. SoEX]
MYSNHSGNNKENQNPRDSHENSNNNIKKKQYNLGYIIKKLIKKFIKYDNKPNNKRKSNFFSNKFIITISVSLLSIWILSGFYTIQESEYGVLTRFGKFNYLAEPGLNWKFNFIDEVKIINTKTVRELSSSGVMLTADENLVYAEITLRYTVVNPKYYLYSVINAEDSLLQATKSSLRTIIGRTKIEDILTKRNDVICDNTKHQIDAVIGPYRMGVNIIGVDIQKLQPPEELQSVFNDVMQAKKNKEKSILKAKNYFDRMQIIAKNQSNDILEEAHVYQKHRILNAEGEAKRFAKILPQYKSYPKITREFLYIEAIQNILNNSRKILVDTDKNSIMLIPTDSSYKKNSMLIEQTKPIKNKLKIDSNNNINDQNKILNTKNNNIMDQRKANTIRSDIKREKRE